ncbi:PssE/Cps14G family polysaccharide biosynthesis glycosyltransferase [Sinomicrobium oceani]|uniref:PssE/Cps14G family polysaccharide biosynthesis glycosyltransferase n=1 Tax=Sinomicrobium oceani TaxID=1150368 RepID=UPI00227C45AB|nr:PssE/Cps14G family polysaccharide biosynthesis glycosyltransferase [Sinomicrobium oceani]
MIFVTVGNQNFQFQRLLKVIESLKKEGIITDDIIAQLGYTKFESKYIKSLQFLSKQDYDNYIEKADYIISHAGTGSIITCLKKKKKVIVACRLKKFNEHVDNHQLEILDTFTKANLIIALKKDFSDLKEKIENIDQINLEKFESNNSYFNKKLIEIIENI